jgi:PAS domain S-box-containing protein
MELSGRLTAESFTSHIATEPRIFLDPGEAEREKAKKSYRHHVFLIPCLRAFGLPLIALAVLLHDLYLTPTPSAWTYFWRLLALYTIYIVVSWLSLLVFYSAVRKFPLGQFFLLFDIFLFLIAIYYSGGEKSWLFFLLMVRTADQTRTTRRNTMLFAIASTAGYVLLMVYLAYFEKRALSIPAELTKIWFVFGSNIYLSFVAKASDDLRNIMVSAVRVSRDLIRQLQAQSTALQVSERDYRALVEGSIQGIFIHQRGIIQLANPAAARIFGYENADVLIGSDHTTLAAEHERDRLEGLTAAFTEGLSDQECFEYMGVRLDGTFVRIECLVSHIMWCGAPAIQTTLQDITARREAEEALRREYSFRNAVIENLAEGLCVCHGTTEYPFVKFTIWNDCMTEITGYTVEEINHLGWHQTVCPDLESQAKAVERMKRMQHGENLCAEEWEINRADGSRRVLTISTSVVESDPGLVHVLALVQDITDRKLAQEALQLSETRYRLLAENATDVIWTVDMDMRLTYVSPSVTRLLGFTAEEAIARTMQQAYTPESYDRAMKIFAEEMAHESAGHGDPKRSRILELELVRKNGNTVLVEGNFSFLRNPAGNAISLLSIVRDITERKRGEQALRKSEEHYRSLFENMLDGFAYCKVIFENEQPVDFEYLAVNRAFEELTGLENVIGRKVTEVIPGIRESNPEMFEICCRVALTRCPERFETYLPELGIWLVISVYSHEEGSFVSIFDNISDRKKAEAALRSANEELEKYVEERTAELKAKTVNLEEVNTALKVLLDRREKDRKEFEEAIAGNLKSLILPYIEKLQRTRLSSDQATYLSILQSHLAEIESRFIRKLSLQDKGLTPTEIQVAVLIRDGKETKDVAEVLHVSVKAVEFHRNNIRRKLSIKNKKENLRSHLIALS